MLHQIRICQLQITCMVPCRLLLEIPESRKKDLLLRIDLTEGDGILIFPAFFHLSHLGLHNKHVSLMSNFLSASF